VPAGGGRRCHLRRVLAERTAVVPKMAPYRPGEFYRRELPPLRAVMGGMAGLGLLMVDGYADLDPDGRPRLGARAHVEFGIPVIGVAKTRFRSATHAVAVLRGNSTRPVLSPLPRCVAPGATGRGNQMKCLLVAIVQLVKCRLLRGLANGNAEGQPVLAHGAFENVVQIRAKEQV
jgi:deoxyinosine 3'endonuclease (endonuclease V)